MKYIVFSLALLFFSQCSTDSDNPNSDEDTPLIEIPTSMFIGTYTRDEGWVNGQGDGVYQATIDYNQQEIRMVGIAAELINPSFVAVSPDKQNLYAVSEIGGGGDGHGYIYAYTLDEAGNATFIDRYPTNAYSPAHVSVDATGKYVFVANYQGGVAMVYQRAENGSLTIVQQLDHSGSGPHQNQGSSHVHMAKVSPDNNFLFLPDLGSDKVWSYRINHEAGNVSKTEQEFISLPGGSGPRHMDFHPTSNLAFVLNELNSTVSSFRYNPEDGSLEHIETVSSLPGSFTDWNSGADIHVHPNGNFLYSSNRGHNSIAVYSINAESGSISTPNHTSTEGEFPRNFNIDPAGDFVFVANQNSNSITIFTVNSETGALQFTGNLLEVPTPVNITFF